MEGVSYPVNLNNTYIFIPNVRIYFKAHLVTVTRQIGDTVHVHSYIYYSTNVYVQPVDKLAVIKRSNSSYFDETKESGWFRVGIGVDFSTT